MAQITSRLWKAAQLCLHSRYFPAMVQAACWIYGKTYSDVLLFKVATNQTLLDNIVLEDTSTSIDVPLLQLMITKGTQIDTFISNVVQNYTPPTTTTTP